MKRIVCDVPVAFHRFDIAVVEFVDPDLIEITLYERCAMHGEGGIWAREGGAVALRKMLARFGEKDALVITKSDRERETHVRVPASHLVVARHYAPGEV